MRGKEEEDEEEKEEDSFRLLEPQTARIGKGFDGDLDWGDRKERRPT